MNLRRAFIYWGALFALAIAMGGGVASATHKWDCWVYADASINWYNGATGTYYNILQEEAVTDTDSWHNYTDIDLTSVASAGSTDHINAYNGYYGINNWLGLAEIVSNDGCTVLNGRARLNQSYLESGYSRSQKEHVACQEVGHLFGLDHNRGESDTCMNDTILSTPQPQPNAHDQALINSLY